MARHVDRAKSLLVGPHRAGANPGEACPAGPYRGWLFPAIIMSGLHSELQA